MQLFFLPQLTIKCVETDLNEKESYHVCKVLRKKTGDKISITNGRNILFNCLIVDISKKKCRVKIINYQKQEPPSYYLHVGISILKSRERFEWFVEKSSEIGISEITPLVCERTERKSLNVERVEKILVSAMKQSLSLNLPKLNPVTKFEDLVVKKKEEKLFIAHCENTQKKTLMSLVKPGFKNLVLIGPEGDFSKNEIKLANDHNFKNITLGNSRLRSETAGLYVCNSYSIANM